MLAESQRERIQVVLVSPRNPLNIGAVARAMANFGFTDLAVVAPWEPHWREARSAVGAPELLGNARQTSSLVEAVRDCTLVLGTGSLTHRRPEQSIVQLHELAPVIIRELEQGGRIALVFGPEKHGLTREDLSWCHLLVEIPTDPRQPSMNLGQAVAVCLYELAAHAGGTEHTPSPTNRSDRRPRGAGAPSAENLNTLALLIEEVMVAAGYSPQTMHLANRHDLRLMLRRLHLNQGDTRRILGLFRRILWRLKRLVTL